MAGTGGDIGFGLDAKNDNFLNFYRQGSEQVFDGNDENDRNDFPRLHNTGIDDFEYFGNEKFRERFKYSVNNLSILNFNIRGINKNYDNLLSFLNSLNYKFDAIILNECHIYKDINNIDLHSSFPITGYKLFYIKSNIKYGGVMIYLSENYTASYLQELTLSTNFYDSCYIKIDKPGKPLFIGSYYRFCRTSKDDIISFTAHLDAHLSNKALANKDLIIAGEFNVCFMKSTYNQDALCLLNTILQNNLEIHIFKPTRIQHYKNSLQVKSATIIDQICSNLAEFHCKSGNLFYPDSDHFANFTIFENYFGTSTHRVKEEVYRRNFKNINQDQLIQDVYDIDWNNLVYAVENIDMATDNLINEVELLLDKHAPLQKISNRRQKYFYKPWIDKQLLEEIKLKNKLFNKQKQTPTESNKLLYKLQRNKTTASLRNKKKEYFANYFEKFRQDSKKMWNGINLALEKSKSSKTMPNTVKDTKGNELTNPKNIATAFAKYFEHIPSKTKAKIKVNPLKHYLDYLHKHKPIDSYLTLTPTNEQDVLSHILSLKNNSSPGPLQSPNHFIKLIATPISTPLSYIINRSMATGYVPVCFKIGKQTPVFKSGDMSITNFRPITVCNSFSKLLEKVVKSKVTAYLDKFNILNKKQFGFRSKHSTNHAIINLLESTLDGLDQKLKVGGVFLDISKAFDCVNHDILLRKLEYYGFRGNTLMWFESYLKNRAHYVAVKKSRSELYYPTYGVPQGSTLAPILFILFMNDITFSSSILEFSMYADDTALTLAINRQCYDEILKAELTKVIDWFSCNELMLNIEKTDYIYFGPHHYRNMIKGEYDMKDLHDTAPLDLFIRQDHEPDYVDHVLYNKKGEFILNELHFITPDYLTKEYFESDDGAITVENETVKYLGLHIDRELKFDKHINITCCKVNRMVGSFWKCTDLGIETKKVIYHSLVESHLSFGITIYAANFGKTLMSNYANDYYPLNLKPLKKAQNNILRSIFRLKKYDKSSKTNTCTSPLYLKLDILKLQDLYYYYLGLLCFDYYNNTGFPERMKDLYTPKSIVTKKTMKKSELDFYYKVPNLNNTYKKPSLASAIFWNSLPIEIKSIKTKHNFKCKIKNYLQRNY